MNEEKKEFISAEEMQLQINMAAMKALKEHQQALEMLNLKVAFLEEAIVRNENIINQLISQLEQNGTLESFYGAKALNALQVN